LINSTLYGNVNIVIATTKIRGGILMKKTIAIFMVLMIIVSVLAACGGSGLSGKYYLFSMTEDGETAEAAQLADYGIDPDQFYAEFLPGNKFKMVVFGEVDEGTYKLDGKNLSMTVDDEEVIAKIDGKKIIIDIDNSQMVFEKRD